MLYGDVDGDDVVAVINIYIVGVVVSAANIRCNANDVIGVAFLLSYYSLVLLFTIMQSLLMSTLVLLRMLMMVFLVLLSALRMMWFHVLFILMIMSSMLVLIVRYWSCYAYLRCY